MGKAFVQATRGLLQLAPENRTSMADLLKAVRPQPLLPVFKKAAGERGPFTLLQGRVEDDLLRLLRADPAWNGSLKAFRRCGRVEEEGFCGDAPPDTPTVNNIKCARKLRARSVRAFMAAYRKKKLRSLRAGIVRRTANVS